MYLRKRNTKDLEKLHNFYPSQNIITVKSTIRSSGHDRHKGEVRSTYKILVGMGLPERKRPLERLMLRLEDNIQLDFKWG